MRFPAFALVALVVLSPMSAMARDVYECKFDDNSNNMNYLPLLVYVVREGGGDTVSVVDGIIQAEKGGPIEVKIAAENDAKLSVSWSIMLQSSMNDYVNMAYRISIQKRGLAASMTGQPQGFANKFTAQGRCTLQKG